MTFYDDPNDEDQTLYDDPYADYGQDDEQDDPFDLTSDAEDDPYTASLSNIAMQPPATVAPPVQTTPQPVATTPQPMPTQAPAMPTNRPFFPTTSQPPMTTAPYTPPRTAPYNAPANDDWSDLLRPAGQPKQDFFEDLRRRGLWGDQYGAPVGRGDVQVGGGVTGPTPSYITGVRNGGGTAPAQSRSVPSIATSFAPAKLPEKMDTSSRQANLTQWAPALQYLEQETGLSAQAVGAIIIAENGGGQSKLSRDQNNYFSISNVGRKFQVQGAEGRFATYATPQDSLNDFVDLIRSGDNGRNPSYLKAWENRSNPELFWKYLIEGGYIKPEPGFPVETWMGNLRDGAKQYSDVAGAQNPAPPISAQVRDNKPGVPDMSQEGQELSQINAAVMGRTQPTLRGLTKSQKDYANSDKDPDAWAMCSLFAGSAQLAALGIDIDPAALKGHARQVGWTPGDGQAGPVAHAQMVNNLLRENGSDAKAVYQEGIDWARVRNDVMQGRPVVLNAMTLDPKTRIGHYFVVEDYDPSTGRYYLGNSLLSLKAGNNHSGWVTPDELVALQSTTSINMNPTGAIFIEGGTPVSAGGGRAQPAAPSSSPQATSMLPTTTVTTSESRPGTSAAPIRHNLGRPLTLYDLAMGTWNGPAAGAPPPPKVEYTQAPAAPSQQQIPDWRRRAAAEAQAAAAAPKPQAPAPRGPSLVDGIDLEALEREKAEAKAYQEQLQAYIEQTADVARKNMAIEKEYQDANTGRLIRGGTTTAVNVGGAIDAGAVATSEDLGTEAGEDRPAMYEYPHPPTAPATPNLDRLTAAANKKREDDWRAAGADENARPERFSTVAEAEERARQFMYGSRGNEERIASEYGTLVGEARQKYLDDLQKEQERRAAIARGAAFVPDGEYSRLLEANSANGTGTVSVETPGQVLEGPTEDGTPLRTLPTTQVFSTPTEIDALPEPSEDEINAVLSDVVNGRVRSVPGLTDVENAERILGERGYYSPDLKDKLKGKLAQNVAVNTAKQIETEQQQRGASPTVYDTPTPSPLISIPLPGGINLDLNNPLIRNDTDARAAENLRAGFRDVQSTTGAGLMGIGQAIKLPSLQEWGAQIYTNALQANRVERIDPESMSLADKVYRAAPSMLTGIALSVPVTLGLAVVGAPAAAITATGVGISVLSTFIQEGGDAYQEALKSGATQEQATAALLIKGSVNSAIESLPIGAALRKIPGGEKILSAIGKRFSEEAVPHLAAKLTNNAAGRLMIAKGANVGADALADFLAEGGQEWVQEAVGIAVENLYKDSSFLQLFEQRGLESFLVGGALGAATTGASAVAEAALMPDKVWASLYASTLTERSGSQPGGDRTIAALQPPQQPGPASPLNFPFQQAVPNPNADPNLIVPRGNQTPDAQAPEAAPAAPAQPNGPRVLQGTDQPLLETKYDDEGYLTHDPNNLNTSSVPDWEASVAANTTESEAIQNNTAKPIERMQEAIAAISAMERVTGGLNADQRAYLLERYGFGTTSDNSGIDLGQDARQVAALAGYHLSQNPQDAEVIQRVVKSMYSTKSGSKTPATFQKRVNDALASRAAPRPAPQAQPSQQGGTMVPQPPDPATLPKSAEAQAFSTAGQGPQLAPDAQRILNQYEQGAQQQAPQPAAQPATQTAPQGSDSIQQFEKDMQAKYGDNWSSQMAPEDVQRLTNVAQATAGSADIQPASLPESVPDQNLRQARNGLRTFQNEMRKKYGENWSSQTTPEEQQRLIGLAQATARAASMKDPLQVSGPAPAAPQPAPQAAPQAAPQQAPQQAQNAAQTPAAPTPQNPPISGQNQPSAAPTAPENQNPTQEPAAPVSAPEKAAEGTDGILDADAPAGTKRQKKSLVGRVGAAVPKGDAGMVYDLLDEVRQDAPNKTLAVKDVAEVLENIYGDEPQVLADIVKQLGISGIREADGTVRQIGAKAEAAPSPQKQAAPKNGLPEGQRRVFMMAPADPNTGPDTTRYNRQSVDISDGRGRIDVYDTPSEGAAHSEFFQMVPLIVNEADIKTDQFGQQYIDAEGGQYIPIASGAAARDPSAVGKAQEAIDKSIKDKTPTGGSGTKNLDHTTRVATANGSHMTFQKDELSTADREAIASSATVGTVVQATQKLFNDVRDGMRAAFPNLAQNITFGGLAWMPRIMGLTRHRGPNHTILMNIHTVYNEALKWAARVGVDPNSDEFRRYLAGLYVGTMGHEMAHTLPKDSTLDKTGHGGSHAEAIRTALMALDTEALVADMYAALTPGIMADLQQQLGTLEESVGVDYSKVNDDLAALTKRLKDDPTSPYDAIDVPKGTEPEMLLGVVSATLRAEGLDGTFEAAIDTIGNDTVIAVTPRQETQAAPAAQENVAPAPQPAGPTPQGQVSFEGDASMLAPGTTLARGDQVIGFGKGGQSGPGFLVARVYQELYGVVRAPGSAAGIIRPGAPSTESPERMEVKKKIGDRAKTIANRDGRKGTTFGDTLRAIDEVYGADVLAQVAQNTRISGYTFTDSTGTIRTVVFPHARIGEQNVTESNRSREPRGILGPTERGDGYGEFDGTDGSGRSFARTQRSQPSAALRTGAGESSRDANLGEADGSDERVEYVPGTNVIRNADGSVSTAGPTEPKPWKKAAGFWSPSQGAWIKSDSLGEAELYNRLENAMHKADPALSPHGKVVEWRSEEGPDGSPLAFPFFVRDEGRPSTFNPDVWVAYEDGHQEIIEVKATRAIPMEDTFYQNAADQADPRIGPRKGWAVQQKVATILAALPSFQPGRRTGFRIIASDDQLLTGRRPYPYEQQHIDVYNAFNGLVDSLTYSPEMEAITDPQERTVKTFLKAMQEVQQIVREKLDPREGTFRAAPSLAFVANPDLIQNDTERAIPGADRIIEDHRQFGVRIDRMTSGESPASGGPITVIAATGDIMAVERQAAQLAKAAGTHEDARTFVFHEDSRGTDYVHSFDVRGAGEDASSFLGYMSDHMDPDGPTLSVIFDPDGNMTQVVLSSRTPNGQRLTQEEFNDYRDNLTDIMSNPVEQEGMGLTLDNIYTARGKITHFSDPEEGGIDNAIARRSEALGTVVLGTSTPPPPIRQRDRDIPVGSARGEPARQYEPRQSPVDNGDSGPTIPNLGVVRTQVDTLRDYVRENPDITREELRDLGIRTSVKNLQIAKNLVAREQRGEAPVNLTQPIPFLAQPETMQAQADEEVQEYARQQNPPGALPQVPGLNLNKFSREARAPIRAAALAIQAVGGPSPTTRQDAIRHLGTTPQDFANSRASSLSDIELAAIMQNLNVARANIENIARQFSAPNAPKPTEDQLRDFIMEGLRYQAMHQQLKGDPEQVRQGSREYTKARRNTQKGETVQQHIDRILGYARTSEKHGKQFAREFVNQFHQGTMLGATSYQMAKAWEQVLTPRTTIGDWLLAVMYNALLGPATAGVAVTFNTLEVHWRLLRDLGSAGANVALNTATLGRAGYGLNEALSLMGAEAQGYGLGFFRSFNAAYQTVRHGATRANLALADVPHDRLQHNNLGHPVLSTAADKIGLAAETFFGRLFSAADAFAKTWAYSMELGRVSVLESKKMNNGKVDLNIANNLFNNPTEAMMERAQAVGLESVFQGKMGAFGEWLAWGQNYPVVGRMALPFLRTIYHGLARGVDRSPLGAVGTLADIVRTSEGKNLMEKIVNAPRKSAYLRGDLSQLQAVRPAAERFQDAVMGTVAYGIIWNMLQEGILELTGEPPDDEKDRDEWVRLGKTPYSLSVNGGPFIGYANWGVPAPGLALLAEIHKEQKKGIEGRQANAVWNVMTSFGKALLTMSFFSTLAEVMEAAGGRNREDKFINTPAGRYAESLFASRIPILGAFTMRLGQTQDPYVRYPDAREDIAKRLAQSIISARLPAYIPFSETVLGHKVRLEDAIGGKIGDQPIGRETLKPSLDIWGFPVMNPFYDAPSDKGGALGTAIDVASGIGQVFNPLRIGPERRVDPVDAELRRLTDAGVDKRPTRAPDEYEGHKFTDDEMWEWKRRVGQESYARLAHLFQQPIYQSAPMDGEGSKARMIDAQYNAAKESAWNSLAIVDPGAEPKRDPKYLGIKEEAAKRGIPWWQFEKEVEKSIRKWNDWRDAVKTGRKPPVLTPEEIRTAAQYSRAQDRLEQLETQRARTDVKRADDDFPGIPFTALPPIP